MSDDKEEGPGHDLGVLFDGEEHDDELKVVFLENELDQTVTVKARECHIRDDIGEIEEEEGEKVLPELIPGSCKEYIPRRVKGECGTDLNVLYRAYKRKKNTLLEGPTGGGKTHALRYLSWRLKVPYMRVGLNGGTTVEDFVGQWVPKDGTFVWCDGVLTMLMRHGGIFVCDEINAAPTEILFALNSLLDDERRIVLVEKDGEVVHACDKFWFVATMNPDNEYEGTKKLNEALKDRFNVTLVYPYDETVERKLVIDPILVELAAMLRMRKDEIRTPVSTRMLIQYQENQALFGSEVAGECFVNKFHIDERSVVRELVKLKLGGI